MKFIFKFSLLLLIVFTPAMVRAQNSSQETPNISELPPPCGNEVISIASMQWPSASILAQIHALILAKQYGCEIKITTGDLSFIASSMATTGQPLVAPEMWISYIPELYNAAIKTQSIRKSAQTYQGSDLEAWFIPKYVAKNHPDLTSVSVLKDYWQVFRLNQGEKARFISCPKDWACSIINKNMLKALGLVSNFEIIEPADRFELDNIIADAQSKKQSIIFYYWQPNSVLAQFDFLQLDMGEYNSESFNCLGKIECQNPKPSSFAPKQASIILADKIFQQSPQIASYFQRASMPIKEMNQLLAMQSEGQKTIEKIANWFVNERQEIWQKWVGIN